MGISSRLAILKYPGALQSAVYGLSEMFQLATLVSEDLNLDITFDQIIIDIDEHGLSANQKIIDQRYKVIIIPPSVDRLFSEQEKPLFIEWLIKQHSQGTIICAVCSGVFVLAQTGLLDNSTITTHWAFSSKFEAQFPTIKMDTGKIIINDGI